MKEYIFESLCIEVEFCTDKSILVASMYRPPGHNLLTPPQQCDAFFKVFENLLSRLFSQNREVFILTDSKLDLLSINSNKSCSKFFDCCLNNGFLNII